jgi:radical SAM protein (TIGR01212 family)
VQKVTIDAGFTCPNRDGRVGWGGCIYCDARGSGAFGIERRLSVKAQVEIGMRRLKERYNAPKFIAYFQAFTNTYAPVEVLKKLYDEALQFDDVIGLAIGTRPDCVPEPVLQLIESYSRRYQVWVEYGLQSIHDQTLALINRGHTYADFVDAVERTKGRGILICAHVIIGLPDESEAEIMETAKGVASLGLDAIKIHSLYVVEGTPLAKLYRLGKFKTLDLDEYVDVVCDFLEYLPPQMIIQRLVGEGSRDTLVAPLWTLKKDAILEALDRELERRDSYQGKRYVKRET